MKRLQLFVFAVAVSIGMAGCGSDDTKTPPAGGNGEPAATEGDETTSAEQQAEIDAALASLSDEDRALAIAQVNCPVGGGKLGSMDTPVKVNIKGRDVFLCCEGCRGNLEKDPDKYLAKLDAQ
ncbi:MAG: hypothetical protein WD278_09285 [Pirellulales bacterium]